MTNCKNIIRNYYDLVRENTLRPDPKVAKLIFKMRPIVESKCPTFGGKKASKRSRNRRSIKRKKSIKKTRKTRKVTRSRK